MIRLLTIADLPAAMRLKDLAGWNQTEDDWRRLLALEPEGCFAACEGGRVVGTATTTTYGADLAWIGMVLVDPEFRRRGIATRLMQECLGYLRGRVATVKLDATPAGQPVYEALGFVEEGRLERWLGKVARSSACAPQTAHYTADLRAFGADRSRLLRLLPPPLVIPGGYAFTRPGSRALYAGPIVAEDAAIAGRLLDALPAGEYFIDLHTGFPGGQAVLAQRGFVRQRDLIRMRLGDRGGGTSPLVLAIAGPEVG
jgi:GNAT superfamily N-acetyltransferase